MTHFDRWVRTRASAMARLNTTSRGAAAWTRIQDRPSSVVLIREGVSLAVQTVRLEPTNARTIGDARGDGGSSGRQTVLVMGVRNCDGVKDTDIRRDDRFALEGKQYRVTVVNLFPGEVQAIAEALS